MSSFWPLPGASFFQLRSDLSAEVAFFAYLVVAGDTFLETDERARAVAVGFCTKFEWEYEASKSGLAGTMKSSADFAKQLATHATFIWEVMGKNGLRATSVWWELGNYERAWRLVDLATLVAASLKSPVKVQSSAKLFLSAWSRLYENFVDVLHSSCQC